ncbi:MAG: HmuY family protein, partial [Pseudobdellovibrionaceae bacterium]|nr:HmuY family protein [Pseudobdellovibrionaceae bacterium]
TSTPERIFEVQNLTLDATQKSVWVYHGLKEGALIPMTKDQPWIIGTNRYMWQTNTGSSGTFEGGAYEVNDQTFDAITSCDTSRLVKDVIVPPLGSIHEGITTTWWNMGDSIPVPIDNSFVMARDNECIKVKLLSYDKGLYTLKLQRLK